eukprot:GHVU01156831.1.p2 GENE.GHVU01156831.1~~GHVU01156831.1.p2  ORF type:complete len:102 (+),score=1.73 GHVU01156831.1:329-634(+)
MTYLMACSSGNALQKFGHGREPLVQRVQTESQHTQVRACVRRETITWAARNRVFPGCGGMAVKPIVRDLGKVCATRDGCTLNKLITCTCECVLGAFPCVRD